MNTTPQVIDPLVSVRPARNHTPPAGQYGTRWLRNTEPAGSPRPARPAPARSIEGIHHRPARPHQTVIRSAPPTRYPDTPLSLKSASSLGTTTRKRPVVNDMRPARTTTQYQPVSPPVPPLASQPKTRTTVRPVPSEKQPPVLVRLFQKTQLLGMLLLAIAVGLLMQSLVFGELAIGAYAVFALTRHVTSRTTFLLALIALAGIILLLFVNANSSMMSNFAVYTFLLLAVGTASLGLEIHRGNL